jgi:hypothetical protein
MILLEIRDIPEVGRGAFQAINWLQFSYKGLQFSYKVVIWASLKFVKEKFKSYKLITI